MFEVKCNKESVALERLEQQDDLEWLKVTLEDFRVRTGSVVAKEILDNWETEVKHFIKVS